MLDMMTTILPVVKHSNGKSAAVPNAVGACPLRQRRFLDNSFGKRKPAAL